MKRSKKIPIIDVKKYGGKQVAILGNKIIASGNSLEEVLTKAKKKAPTRPLNEFKVFSVPKTLAVIYYA